MDESRLSRRRCVQRGFRVRCQALGSSLQVAQTEGAGGSDQTPSENASIDVHGYRTRHPIIQNLNLLLDWVSADHCTIQQKRW